jgi:hippurate hydrolase
MAREEADEMDSAVIEHLKRYEPELIAIRRDIHRHPEVAFEEERTAGLVADCLRSWGIDVATGIAKTGVVGTLRGRRAGGRAIGLRADIDALHISEATGRAYASEVPGKMHACGHDGHTAMLLGAARYLAERPDFAGTVRFIFQPAEEGLGGGRAMVEEGLFERFPVDAVYGMHNAPGLPVGAFATRVGPFMASSDSWTTTFHGTGGHGGAGPHLATDATVPLGHFVLALQTIIGRNVPAIETAVVSVGHIAAGDFRSPNIIPSIVVVRGTARSYNPAIRDLLERRIGELAHTLAAAYGCTAEYDYERRYPPLITHAEQTGIAIAAASDLVGVDAVSADAPPRTGAEDFAFMLEKRPGAFIMIGAGAAPDGSYHNLHTPLYDFNDEILTLGAAYWVSLVGKELG